MQWGLQWLGCVLYGPRLISWKRRVRCATLPPSKPDWPRCGWRRTARSYSVPVSPRKETPTGTGRGNARPFGAGGRRISKTSPGLGASAGPVPPASARH
eukprot:9115133-Pyramimonas_sp.AAC.1